MTDTTPQSASESQFQALVNSGDYAGGAKIIAGMYQGSAGGSAAIPGFLASVEPFRVFPVVYQAATLLGAQGTAFVDACTPSADMARLLKACQQGTPIGLSCFNTSLGQTVYLNGTGQLWSGGPSYKVTTDPAAGPGAASSCVPQAYGEGVTFHVATPFGTNYLNGTGELWSGGPSYYVSADLPSRAGASFTFLVAATGVGLRLYVDTQFGQNFLNGMGDSWGGGPSWFVTTDLASRSGSVFDWNVA